MNQNNNNIFSTYNICECAFLDPPILEHMIKEGTEEQRNNAIKNLHLSAKFRAARTFTAGLPRMITALDAQGAKNRTIYTMNNSGNYQNLPGVVIMREGESEEGHDQDTIKCYQYSGQAFDFFKEVFGRTSIDDNGYPLNLSVHFDRDYDNAFWAPWSLSWAFGEGGGGFFKPGRMTDASVVFHEYQHGVTQYTSGFDYDDEWGGLNESMSDVFSAICEQKINNQSFENASWLIGDGMIVDDIGKALRSMEDPGNRSKTHRWDDQIQHYRDFNSNMDPHICSGIANKAFYLVCKDIGGYSWEKPGKIWYKALTAGRKPNCTFVEFASRTIEAAKILYSNNEQKVVENAWSQVGIEITELDTNVAFVTNRKFR